MNIAKVWNPHQLFRRITSLLLSAVLIVGVIFSYSGVAQAAVDTTSAATKGDADRINQRKQEAPHYPNWYENQRSLESYTDEAGVNLNRRGNDPMDQNNAQDDQGNLIERSRQQLENVADSVREMIQPDKASDTNAVHRSYNPQNYNEQNYNDTDASADELGGRVKNRLERAKGAFQEATERTAEGGTTITGESNY
jgi:hypothetical protein